jgi:polyhydroxybutyrate depolymerase
MPVVDAHGMKVIRIVWAALAMALFAPGAAHAASGEIEVEGHVRTYVVHVPDDLKPGRPLVFAFHGLGGNGQAMQALTRMNGVADEHGFVVVYPDGIDRVWRFGLSEIDDLAFVDAMIDHFVATLGVDPARVYATGMSNGGFFTTYLGCARPERIAAIATVAAPLAELQKLGCAWAPPRRVQMIAGTEDPLVPWEGNGWTASVPESAQWWITHNQLALEPTLDDWLPNTVAVDGTRTHRTVWGEGQLEVLGVVGGGHTWPGGIQYLPVSAIGRTSRDFSASEAIWQFFDQ